jgi:hypothetical protein
MQNHVHLGFDQYEEKQIFAINAQEGNDNLSRISVSGSLLLEVSYTTL